MSGKEAIEHSVTRGETTGWGKCLGGAVLLLLLVALGCSGGEERAGGKKDQKAGVPESAVTAPAVTRPPEPAPNATATRAEAVPEVKPTPPVKPEKLTLGLTPEEFRQGFNKNAELVKSKLRVKKLPIVAGADLDAFKHVFNDNLYLTGTVNRQDGLIAELTLFGVLNGSLATTVDLNTSIIAIITVVSPKLSQGARDSLLNGLGINRERTDIYNLDRKVTKNGVTYWLKSSRKDLRFGVER